MLHDIRYALRLWRLKPGFIFISILTLAGGIGATTAIFSIVDAVLIRPLPYPDSDRLISIATKMGQFDFVGSPEYVEWREANHVLSEMAAWPRNIGSAYLTMRNEPIKIGTTRVSDNFFEALQIHPLLGRGFLPSETIDSPANVIILSFGLWQRAFGGRPEVLGRSIVFEGKPYTIIGIVSQQFQFPQQGQIDALTPLPIRHMTDRRQMSTWNVIGRLRPGVTIAQARADFERLFAITRARYADMYKHDTTLQVSLLQAWRVKEVRLALIVLFAAVSCVLLIACANIANLWMGRAVARQSEVRIRAALGAGRVHLLRQFLTESLLAALASGSLGVAIAIWSLRAIQRFGPPDVPGFAGVSVDLRVLCFAIAVSVLTGILFGVAPAIAAWRTDLRVGGAHYTTGPDHRGFRHALVASELAICVVLAISAVLLMRSLWNLRKQNMGFQPESVLTADLSVKSMSDSKVRDVLARVQRLPSTISAALSGGVPPPGAGDRMSTFSSSDRPFPEPWHRGDNMLVRRVTPDYFRALGTPLLKGRFFTESDRAETGGVAIINQSLAQRYFPGEDPLGKQIDGLGGFHWKTIVGITGDAKNRGLDKPVEPEMFTPLEPTSTDVNLSLIVRVAGNPIDVVPSVRDSLRTVDKQIPVTFRTMEQSLSELIVGHQFNAFLFGAFAMVAVLLCVVGTYGVLTFSVAQRTREIAIRMALGAKKPDIVKLIAREAMALTISGLILGLAGASLATRLLTNQLYSVNPKDVVTFSCVPVVLMLTAAVATYLPARRAATVDPMQALHLE